MSPTPFIIHPCSHHSPEPHFAHIQPCFHTALISPCPRHIVSAHPEPVSLCIIGPLPALICFSCSEGFRLKIWLLTSPRILILLVLNPHGHYEQDAKSCGMKEKCAKFAAQFPEGCKRMRPHVTWLVKGVMGVFFSVVKVINLLLSSAGAEPEPRFLTTVGHIRASILTSNHLAL